MKTKGLGLSWSEEYWANKQIKNRKNNMSNTNNATTVFAKGRIFWAKILGDRALHPTYDGDARQWAFEFEPEDTEFLKEAGLLDRLKDKEDAKNPDKGEFLVLKKPELNRDGEKNEPIRVYDADGEPWPEDKLIGNGSKADVKLRIVDWGRGKRKSIYTTAIRITDLVPYISDEFAAMDENDEAPKKKKAAPKKKKAAAPEFDDDLNDDVPFD